MRRRSVRAGVGIAAVAVLLGVGGVPGRALAETDDGASPRWTWPVEGPVRIVDGYAAPAHDYAPGHRGIDLAPEDPTVIRAPASGIVAFSGQVAGRGILTIEHPGGFVTTLEPVTSELAPGEVVEEGSDVADLSVGGHSMTGTLHIGVRLHGEYINPQLLLGGVPRAVLLPCCDPLVGQP